MSIPLRVLIIEDSEDDALLLVRNLRSGGYDPTFKRVDTAEGMGVALEQEMWDIVISDYSMPRFSAPAALDLLKKNGLDLPFILVSGAIGEGTAVATMKAGAHDYIMKDNLVRLVPAIDRELREAELRQERRQAQKALRDSAQEWRVTFDAISDGICLLDMKGTILRCNKSMANLLGKRYDDIIGGMCWEVVHGTSQPIEGCPFLRMKKTHNRETIVLSMHDRWFEVAVDPLLDEYGKLIGAVHIMSDFTSRKRLEDQLRQKQKMEAIGTLAGGIAHDFNNILSAIIGYTELAREDVPEGSDIRANLDQVFQAGVRAKDLVKQILTFSRKNEQERVPVIIHLIVKEALKLLRSTLPTTIKIHQGILSSGMVMADPAQIHQVVINLCTNAYHAMEENGGTLGVTLSEVNLDSDAVARYPDLNPGLYLRLTVSDTGHGMDQSTLERIFDPYFTTKEKEKGTGLGLTVVHGIVKGHGGEITVYSELGKGTTFHVFLPEIEDLVRSETKDSESLPMGSERILFVDDEFILVDLGKKILERLGYHVECRTSSIEALEAFRAKPDDFDLVITDMTMPNMTGDKLARKLIQIRPDIPVILCTGFSEKMSEEKAFEIGIKSFLMKPLTGKDLAKTIREVLDKN